MNAREVPDNITLESSSCPLGCNIEEEILLVGHDRINGCPGEFRVVMCPGCGFMWTNPRPTAETMGFYYPDNYGPYEGTQVKRGRPGFASATWFRHWGNKFFETNTTRIPFLKPGRLLEIGCASGSFLHRMASEGWEVEGVEFSVKAAENARSMGYPVHVGKVEDAPDPKEPYDLAVGWMVLEHLHDPLLALQKLHRWVRPGGWLALSVPNADTLEFRIFRDKWYALHLPNHLYHFTPKTLAGILGRGGWTIVRILHQRTVGNLIPSIGYRLKDRGTMARVSEALISYPERALFSKFLLYPLACTLGLFGETGRMTVWARKKDGIPGRL